MLFPIIFIVVGLALATIKPVREGKPRLLSPSIFPEPSNLYYNDFVPQQGIDVSSDIIESYFAQDKLWTTGQPVKIDRTDIKNYTAMVSQFDDALFDNRYNVKNGFFGDYFFYNLNETVPTQKNYGVFALINATSQDAIAVYGAYLH